jgi:DNA-binding response OmpR family regulator
MRVLLVEDEQPLAGYIQAGLREHGFIVDVALDGRSALDKCEITPYEAGSARRRGLPPARPAGSRGC